MPYQYPDNIPGAIKDLPAQAQQIFVAAFNSAFEQYNQDEGKAMAVAWSAVEQKYEKDAEGNWVEKKQRTIEDFLIDFNRVVSEWFETMRERFKPIANQLEQIAIPDPLPQIVTRQADGKLRWFGVAATAVLNHDGMIDSRALFDSFIAHIERTKQYPQYDVLHFGEHCIVGQADYVFRDGAIYYATGTFNDDEFSQAVARGLEQDPAYWGHSIMFLSGQPDKLNIYDVDVPVFTDGINKFISIVPRSRAASMFTDVTVQERGKTMMTDQQYDEMVKLVGKDLADKKRDELTQLNRTIDKAGLISREKKTEEPKAEEPKPAAKPVEPVAEIRAEEPKPAEDKPVENAAGDPAPDEMKTLLDAVTAFSAQINDLMTAMNGVQSEQKQMAERLIQVEKPVEERIAVALADAPEPKTTVITRAREARSGDGKVDPADTLEKLKAQREHRK